MNRVLACGLFFCIVQKGVSEEPFCGNKCFGQSAVVVSRPCHCDDACSTVYNDCCADAKTWQKNASFERSLTCKRKALAVNSCLKEWKGPDFILNSCKGDHNYEMDPIGNSPVTSESTGVTYNNYYCAICNGDAENLLMWNIKMSCPLSGPDLSADKEDAFKSIFYRYATNEWGYVTSDNATKKPAFHGCAVTSEIPQEHESKIRRCDAGHVRTCHATWKPDTIREMCDAYTDPVFSNGTRFRNLYCALCNRVDISTVSCGEGVSPRNHLQPDAEDSNKMSFSLLLDINFSESNSVGKRLECQKGEIFDPFARRCRNIVCGIPGYVMQKGLCSADAQPQVPF